MKNLFFLIASLLIVSCAALPQIRPAAGPAHEAISCPSPFLAEKTRLIHSIEARLSGETKAVMIGITLADPVNRTLSSAILSTEGMVLFEAFRGSSGMTVNRALPPFDAADFARNMMDDIELIFLAPSGAPAQKGILAEGNRVCRWHGTPDGWIDVVEAREGRIYIRRYTEGGDLKRSVRLDATAASPYAAIELRAAERVHYMLVMTLIESEAAKDGLRPGRDVQGSPHEISGSR